MIEYSFNLPFIILVIFVLFVILSSIVMMLELSITMREESFNDLTTEMKLDETTLIEIQDYINVLDEKIGLKPETVEDVRKTISKYRSELKNPRGKI